MNPEIVRLYSENNDFQRLETLKRNRTKRQRLRELFVEGVRPINLALRHGWTVRSFIYAHERERPLSDWARGILRGSYAERHYVLPLALMRTLSGKDETSELLATVAMPPDDPKRLPLREDLLTVVFDRPASPGNLGALLRSCDALGAHGLVITGHAADVYAPETVAASAGSLFAVPVVRLPSHRELLEWFEVVRTGIGAFQVVGASAHAEVDVANHDLTRPTVLLVGNETWGLSVTYRELCDALLRIPMGGSATSLNVASAASILLYEVGRQRRQRRARRAGRPPPAAHGP